uniref:Peptidase S1 domain-containing protein n=1 Tax=Chrysemys picta bellii TaxID=8478 RepID=A0A8C3FTF8_CHRPI
MTAELWCRAHWLPQESHLGGLAVGKQQWLGTRTPGFYSLFSPPFSSACEQPMESPRIVGGNNAENGAWPWQVSIREGSNHICGGSLIAESWVVSAAHSITVRLFPNWEYQLQNPSENLVSVSIKEIYHHPSYTNISSSGDIALVELERAVSFNEVIRPICLPASSVEFPAGMECWVTGWGDTQNGESLEAPKTLQEVQVPLIDRDTCNNLFNTSSYPDDPQGTDPIKQDMICAGYPEGEKDACQGDSGGPLVCKWDNAWLLAGVVSWGVECARPNRPGVYILLPPYADWIQGYLRFEPMAGMVLRAQPQGIIAVLQSSLMHGTAQMAQPRPPSLQPICDG